MPTFHVPADLIASPWFQRTLAIRRDLHQHPELSWQERRTTDRICGVLDSLGIAYRRDVVGSGVVAELPGPPAVPVIALRADIDALPIAEETGLPFASQHPGVMHACGHDGHTAMLLGAAELLAAEKERPAPVRLIFQPAEEHGEGAKALVASGVLDGVGMIFGGHVDRHFPVGTIAVTPGPVNASTDCFQIEIAGRGGHAARPHETIDAVVVGSLMVMALQTIVSREVDPSHPSVVTVGRFAAGTAANVIASNAVLEGSIRALDQDVRLSLHRSVQRIVDSIGQLHGAAATLTIDRGTPPVVNPPHATELARAAAVAALGESSVTQMPAPSMGGEDFSYYQEQVPGCFVRFGTARAGVEHFPTHNSRFTFDEDALAVGAAFFHAAAHIAGAAIGGKAP